MAVKKKPVSKEIKPSKKAKQKAKGKTGQKTGSKAAIGNNGAGKPALSEPPHKLILEYIISASPALLYDFLSSPSGLSEWFADDVNITGDTYTFFWDGSKQLATLIDSQEGKTLRFRWTDRPKNSYFEFNIMKNELTQDLTLLIIDFAESADEKNSLELLWQEQIQSLRKVLGAKV